MVGLRDVLTLQMHLVAFLYKSNNTIMLANALCFAYKSLILFLFKKQPDPENTQVKHSNGQFFRGFDNI